MTGEAVCCSGESGHGKTMKRGCVLVLASVASMIAQFNMPYIRLLQQLGYDVDVACNFLHGNTCPNATVKGMIEKLNEMDVGCYQIDFERNAFRMLRNLKAYRQLEEVFGQGAYLFVHCHSPIGGLIGRIVAKRHGIKTIYTAHGFHFYDGAPIKNWILYYPAEKFLSRSTDVLITINKEDYRRAKRKFHAGKVYYVPGVGIDVKKFAGAKPCRREKRAELGIGEEDIMLLSVGELNKNKNHEIVIRALGRIRKGRPKSSRRLSFFIAGKGKLRKKLLKCAVRNDVDLHLLGYRDDIPQLLAAADLFLLPSRREGLNVGLLEAVASGVPCIASDIRGNRDVLKETGCLVKVRDLNGWAEAISDEIRKSGERNIFFEKNILRYDERYVMTRMREVYGMMEEKRWYGSCSTWTAR